MVEPLLSPSPGGVLGTYGLGAPVPGAGTPAGPPALFEPIVPPEAVPPPEAAAARRAAARAAEPGRTARTSLGVGACPTEMSLVAPSRWRVGQASKVTRALTIASMVREAASSTPVVPKALRVTRFRLIWRWGSTRLIPR